MTTLENVSTARSLYENLGKLFYAIAAADKVVTKEEIRVLDEMVALDWKEVEHSRDEFGTDMSFQIEVIFDWFRENDLSADYAFAKFRNYKREHEYLFDEELNHLIWRTANKIAGAFAPISRAEVTMLSRLRKILK